MHIEVSYQAGQVDLRKRFKFASVTLRPMVSMYYSFVKSNGISYFLGITRQGPETYGLQRHIEHERMPYDARGEVDAIFGGIVLECE